MEQVKITVTIKVTEEELELLKEYRHLNGGISRRAAIERVLRQHLRGDVDMMKHQPVNQSPAYIPSSVPPYQPPTSVPNTNALVSNTNSSVSNTATSSPQGGSKKGLPRFSIS